jgi:hypothetical protein
MTFGTESIAKDILRYANQEDRNAQLLSLLKGGVIRLDDVVYCSYCDQYDEYTMSKWYTCLYKHIMKGCMENCHRGCCSGWTLSNEVTGLYCESCVRNGCLERSSSSDEDDDTGYMLLHNDDLPPAYSVLYTTPDERVPSPYIDEQPSR